MSDDTPTDRREEFEQQWADLTEKEILMGVLHELQQIRLLLQAADDEPTEATQMYECEWCGQHIREDKRQAHAKQHGAPPGFTDRLFTRVID